MKGWFTIKGVIESYTCFLPMITPQSNELLRLFGHYRKGNLAFSGGLLDQPAAYIEAMELLDGTFAQIERERLEEAQRASTRRAR